MMPNRLTAAATVKVEVAEQHAELFSQNVKDAMALADRYADIQPEEYVLPLESGTISVKDMREREGLSTIVCSRL